MSEDRPLYGATAVKQTYTLAELERLGFRRGDLRLPRRRKAKDDSKAKAQLDQTLTLLAASLGLTLEAEYYFLRPRHYRSDWAFPEKRVLIEFEGGAWAWKNDEEVGKHQAERFISDCEKYSYASVNGWILIRVTADMVRSGLAAHLVARALE